MPTFGTINSGSDIALTSVGVLSTVTGIDLKIVATTNLYTVPTGKKAIITDIVIRPTTVAGFAVAATAGVGIAAGEIDIVAATVLTGLTGTTIQYKMSPLVLSVIGNSTEVIKLGVTVGATATTFTASVDLIGYLTT